MDYNRLVFVALGYVGLLSEPQKQTTKREFDRLSDVKNTHSGRDCGGRQRFELARGCRRNVVAAASCASARRLDIAKRHWRMSSKTRTASALAVRVFARLAQLATEWKIFARAAAAELTCAASDAAGCSKCCCCCCGQVDEKLDSKTRLALCCASKPAATAKAASAPARPLLILARRRGIDTSYLLSLKQHCISVASADHVGLYLPN